MKFKTSKRPAASGFRRSDNPPSSARKSGMPAGSLVHIGKVHGAGSSIGVVRYDAESLYQQRIEKLDELHQFKDDRLLTWINVDGLSDTEAIGQIGREFNIHPLVLEDILSTHQRPKLEEYEDYLYLVIKAISRENGSALELSYEQISILLLKNHVITFKEKADDLFQPVFQRLESHQKGRLRRGNSDFLAYVLLDAIVDEYFVAEDCVDELIDPLEESLFESPTPDTLQTILSLRRELIAMRRNVSPLRDVLSQMQHCDTALIDEKTRRYLSDVHDHVLRVNDSLDSFRERIAAMQDLYLSSLSNKMNETMKILTIFATIFIPLGFIAGVYGMNFDYMPELHWRWAYPGLWGLFLLIIVVLLVYFKRMKWL